MPNEENAGKEEQETAGSARAEATVENGQFSGALADASEASAAYSQPSRARFGKNDADTEEQKASRGRNLLRKHLNGKSSQSPWTVPTAKPKYDADSFEDPICDEFWKDIWVACAAHNVCARELPSRKLT
jgi:phospholipase D1/2